MGKLSDKFLDAFSVKADDDDDEFYDDEEYVEDEYETEEEPAPVKEKGGLFGKKKKAESFGGGKAAAGNNRYAQQEVCIFKPSSIEDSREITETLLQGKAVIINFEGLHVEISQRIIDFISGSCYALDGNLQKISNYIFIATPNSVDISGDFQDLFNGDDSNTFDIAGFKSPLL